MKKYLILSALVALPLLFACNKTFNADYANQMTGKPIAIVPGENIDVAQTLVTEGTPKTNEQGQQEKDKETGLDIMTRSSYSLNADNDCLVWDEDYVEEPTKASTTVKILRRYNFRTYKYTVEVKEEQGNVTTIKLDVDENQDISINITKQGETEKVEIVVSHEENGQTVIDQEIKVETVTVPDTNNEEVVSINGTWKVKTTTAIYRGLTFNRDGLDVHAIAQWANQNGWLKEEDVKGAEGYNVTSVMITDSAIAINFENGKSFATSFDSNSLSSFDVKDFGGDENDKDSVSKYFNGTGSFSFFENLCILSINGNLKAQDDSSDTKVEFKLSLIR